MPGSAETIAPSRDPSGLSRALAAATIAIGAAVLVGWALDVDVLKRVAPGLIAMKPNAGLGFVLAGAALWSIRGDRRSDRIAALLAASVAALGALTLFEYASGVDLHIDQILAREPPGSPFSMIPGRMHPTTAFNFTLLGLAMVLIASDRAFRTAHALALLAALIAGSALLGYSYGVRQFHGLAVFNQMALHTAAGMVALSTGILLARPGRGLMGAISGDDAGGVMARRLLPVAILVPVTFDGLAILARRYGVFDERFGTAVRVTATIAVFVGFIVWNAHTLRRVDRERRRSDRAIRFLADSMPQIAWTARPDGRVDYCNPRGVEYTGLAFGGADGPGWGPAIHPGDLGQWADRWAGAVRSGRGYEVEYRLRRASDGSYRWHLGRAEPMRDEAGRVVRWFGTSTDIHDQKTAGERRFRSLVEATAAIVWTTPASGEFESEQPGWSAFTGQDFDRLKGWGWIDAIHPDDRAHTARVWSEAVARRSFYQVEHRVRRHDGVYRQMMVRGVPILHEGGSIHEWIGIHTDVDDQHRAREALREAKEAAEAATRAKGEFLANMSHEIRTPMNGVLGMTELALGTDLTPRQREYLGLVKSSADALLTVIDDILDFSKIEAGKMALDPIAFSPRDAVTDILRTLALRAHGKGLELACRIAPEVPETLVGDPGRLRQVLVNLVGNAIKFTEAGEVVVTVEVNGEGPGHEVRFAVADSGIGIAPGKRAAIFAPFEQADGSTTRKYGGTGLGLTISARLVALMGGRIWVEENPGGGSVFRFTVRLEPDPAPRPARDPGGPIFLADLRVLVVDDNRTNRLILEEVLSQWGCRPVAVGGGPEALEALERAASGREPFAVALLDRMMPGMDGCELAARIRDDPRSGGVKMLMLTSGGGDESIRYRELGIGAWLNKPIRQADLLDALLDILGAARPGPPGPAPTPAPIVPKVGRRLRVLLAEDHPVNQKVATRMLEDQGHAVTVVGDGRMAVEAAGSGVYDVILMDVQMPGMDGFEAVAAIRAREGPAGGRVPIVALTAHAMAGDRERCLGAGFDGYLSKPVHSAALRDALAGYGGPPSGPPAEAVGDGHARPAFDRAAALEGLGGDEALLDEVLGLFLDDLPRLLDAIAVAVKSDDATALDRLAHTVAGVAGTFAAPGVVAEARRLEAMGKARSMAGADDVRLALGREVDRFRASAGATPVDPVGGIAPA